MSCWRLLELSDSTHGQHVPQLLVKTEFGSKTYTVFLTDLSNIWSEELNLAGIVERASQQESPIEVSKQDTAQLAILLDNVQRSLTSADDTICRITRDSTDGITVHSATALPEPLDSLRWKFYLQKRTSITLRNELILPLLISSHIQHERVASLVSSVSEKDKAITRLLDQFESSNMDLATAFPSLGGSKLGRRLVKREQAARHVPALQPFLVDSWKRETGELKDSQISTLGLFQEALSQCTPKIPPGMKSEEEDEPWWTSIRSSFEDSALVLKPIPMKANSLKTPQSEPSDDETEDEFETHEHFQLRETPRKLTQMPEPTSPSAQKQQDAASETETTEDDDDLDAPTRSQSQSQSRNPSRKPPARAKSPEPSASPPPKVRSSLEKPKGFRIGGARVKKGEPDSPQPASSETADDADQPDAEDTGTRDAPIPSRAKVDADGTASRCAKPTRKPFKIGGKQKVSTDSREANSDVLSPPQASKSKTDSAPVKVPLAEVERREETLGAEVEPEANNIAEEHEETAEEKAERKRRELKRKNEELARKQAASKKKKRF